MFMSAATAVVHFGKVKFYNLAALGTLKAASDNIVDIIARELYLGSAMLALDLVQIIVELVIAFHLLGEDLDHVVKLVDPVGQETLLAVKRAYFLGGFLSRPFRDRVSCRQTSLLCKRPLFLIQT